MVWMQSASSRWLAAIASFSAVLIIVSVLIGIFVGNGSGDLLPADSPEGTVQRYLLALTEDDIASAYGYISTDLKDECTLENFLQNTRYRREQDFTAALSKTTDTGSNTIVTVEITEPNSNSPFGQGRYSFSTSFTVTLEDAVWRISEPPWPVFCPPGKDLPARPVEPAATPEPATSASRPSATTFPQGLHDEGWLPKWIS